MLNVMIFCGAMFGICYFLENFELIMSQIKTSVAGKGDKPRPINFKQYQSNYDEIDWRDKNKICDECGITLRDNKLANPDGTFKCFECNWN